MLQCFTDRNFIVKTMRRTRPPASPDGWPQVKITTLSNMTMKKVLKLRCGCQTNQSADCSTGIPYCMADDRKHPQGRKISAKLFKRELSRSAFKTRERRAQYQFSPMCLGPLGNYVKVQPKKSGLQGSRQSLGDWLFVT